MTIGELLQCNDIARLNRHIEIEADWSNTEFLYGNRMTDGRRGLSIISSVGPLAGAGNIGDQGNASSGGFTSDNRWGGTFTQGCIRIDDCGIAGMIDFIVRSSGLPFDASSCISLNGYASSYSPPTFSVNSGLDTIDCSQYYSRLSAPDINSSSSRIKEIGSDMPDYFVWNTHFANMVLLNGAENLTTEEQNYWNEMQDGNIMRIVNIFNGIRSNNYSGLLDQVSEILPTCQQEENYKNFLTIFLTHVEDHSELSENELEILRSILSQCPHRAGKVISNVRTFLGLSDQEYDLNACGDLNEDSAPFISKTINSYNSMNVIYPNPIQSGKDLKFSNALPSNTEFQILDINGRILAVEQKELSVSSIMLPELNPGIYLLKVATPDGLNQMQRFVISR